VVAIDLTEESMRLNWPHHQNDLGLFHHTESRRMYFNPSLTLPLACDFANLGRGLRFGLGNWTIS
jgi:hypothetical protein